MLWLVKEYKKDNRYLAALYVAANLREIDKKEIVRATGKNPYVPALKAWLKSRRKWILFCGNEPVAMFGVIASGNTGYPWMVGTGKMSLAPRAFMCKNSKKYVSEMLKGFKYLVNFVDSENHTSIEWLKWCGFNVQQPKPYGRFGHMFCRFEIVQGA